jgi:uncharacterized protein (TIGR02466 family)
MANIKTLFATRIYQDRLSESINALELKKSCLTISEDDEAGQLWCEKNEFPGYTSYASLNDLEWRFPIFSEIVTELDKHVTNFAIDLQFDLGEKKIQLDSLWINILPFGGIHTAHLHPHSIISGTTYVAMPDGTSPIKFEDPRLAMMMAAPPRVKHSREDMSTFVYASPKVGDVMLWESWLRHEVPMNMADDDRISVSFNYSWS